MTDLIERWRKVEKETQEPSMYAVDRMDAKQWMADFLITLARDSITALQPVEDAEWEYQVACATIETRDKEIEELEDRITELKREVNDESFAHYGSEVPYPDVGVSTTGGE